MSKDSPHTAAEIRDEIASALTHGLGAVAALAGGAVLITLTALHGDAWQLGASIVFGVTLLLLYTASTLYHAIPHQRIKELLQRFDYAAIYLLIAGTYTPIALGVLRGSWGWAMLGVIWGLAVLGAIFKLAVGERFHRLSTALYVGMGWAALIAIRPLWLHMAPGGLAWLLAGGLAYTLGVVFFLLHERVRYSHFIWHLFVMAGTGCHYFTVLRYTF